MRRSLKLKYDTPMWVENRLIVKYGYHLQKRAFKEYLLFVKLDNPNTIVGTANNPTHVVANQSIGPMLTAKHANGPLTPDEESELTRRCDNIVSFFPDPYSCVPQVRTRLHNMRQTLRTIEEQQFVLEYIDENFGEGV